MIPNKAGEWRLVGVVLPKESTCSLDLDEEHTLPPEVRTFKLETTS